uniref:Leucine rich repeat containing 17 n=1 Tax=Paramormyrops kingsleyae TaxID=1676925 RepID=A0A3B3S5L7_9TELE|nr:leucine-rich repeat-containing protein 17-like [Paramormyrops kingsleyae]XP_023672561.1 leucine-rich repeat-containing protein 17-like [Paramormyrops kingsleyae]XP_023672562.1 leucine-rich repeat-containing protein 17-like [Paramormyrops kingsleyae]XP_023672563.1 leucine-rich repeat-containing protein 17-like [Paramormyrops kingsleyae]
MRVIMALFVLLAFSSVQSRRTGQRGGRGRGRGRNRMGAIKRFVSECVEYMESREKYLDCQDQQLTIVPISWSRDTFHLLLARNRIQGLRDNAFGQFPHLRSLDLQQNELTRIEKQAFAGLDQLTTLLLQHNGLHTLSEEVLLPMPHLRFLRLYDNPWHCKCSLDTLVRTLQVPSNRYLGNYAKCAEPPRLKGEKLKRIRPELLCPHLEENILQEPQDDKVKIKFDAVDSCHTYMFPTPLLDCQNRGLTNVPAGIPPDIVKADLSRNKIRHLRPKEFVTAKDLRSLNLSSNGLDGIEIAAFNGLLYLRELDLSNNSLQHIQYGVLEDLYFIRRLVLGGNPWVCDYNIHYLLYWLRLHPGVYHSGLVCQAPPEFAGWTVRDYVRTYDGKCPEDQMSGQDDFGGEVLSETMKQENGILLGPRRGRKTVKGMRLS